MSSDVFWAGCFGGFLIQLLHWVRISKTDLPIYVKTPVYWIVTLLLIVSGGVLAHFFSIACDDVKLVQALTTGAATPLIILKSLAAPYEEPYILGDLEEDEYLKERINIRNFFRG